MSTEIEIEATTVEDSIDAAATTVGSAWPLHSFVTANPLSGFEDQPFHEAAAEAERLFGSDGYPSVDVFRQAWNTGQIDPELLQEELVDYGYDDDPETLLNRMEMARATDDNTADDSASTTDNGSTATEQVDHLLTKWLAAFLDQGQTEWPMPNRKEGFYTAFRTVARHDRKIPSSESIADLPDEPVAAIKQVLDDHPPNQWETSFEFHLTALSGWTGLIKQQVDSDNDWQSTYPITLVDYLAVRLAVADLLDAPIEPPTEWTAAADSEATVPLAEVWLTAWERSYREELVDVVADASASLPDTEDSGRPDAQLVFCIDTRSEIIRRHIESTGAYETHGYAGFFGVPMRYEGYDSAVTVDSCPPIVDVQHRIADRPTTNEDAKQDAYDRWENTVEMGHDVLKALKSNAATAFSFVESAGTGYGAALAARTLVPDRFSATIDGVDHSHHTHEFCEPTVDYNPDGIHELREGLTLEEKVEYAETAFELMGWEQFARLVVFTGHASETSNNPFGSSLDCGACAGNHGGPNARVLAAICNDDEVKAELRADGHDIPDDTIFLAGEHNTTTDEITLYTSTVPESHTADVDGLRNDLDTARSGAAAERAESMGADNKGVDSDDYGVDSDDYGVDETERRAADWAETRPEWGLAGNASFVIGPRELTAECDLDGRAFLHSYDWSTDPDGEALAAIIGGPMVVTQWINTQYYFATVDTGVFGSGSKVTQNPVGNVGVYQGNGGDILTGLPLQSVMADDETPYHQPLRLSTVIHAPVDRVTEVLSANEEVTQLLDNGWLSLTVVDPTQNHVPFHYAGDLEWTALDADQEVSDRIQTTRVAPVADD